MDIREVRQGDLTRLLKLYTYLKDDPVPEIDGSLGELWQGILKDPNHHILIGIDNEEIISSCVLIIVPNLTRKQRPYALIENVVTHPDHRNKGYAGKLLNYAKEMAVQSRCYKIMLMTGSKEKSTLRFYERAGYNCDDKTAFIQWLF